MPCSRVYLLIAIVLGALASGEAYAQYAYPRPGYGYAPPPPGAMPPCAAISPGPLAGAARGAARGAAGGALIGAMAGNAGRGAAIGAGIGGIGGIAGIARHSTARAYGAWY